jgi:hypothetical protein
VTFGSPAAVAEACAVAAADLDELAAEAERLAAAYHAGAAEPLHELWLTVAGMRWAPPHERVEFVADHARLVSLVVRTRRWWTGAAVVHGVAEDGGEDVEDRGWVHVDDQECVPGSRPFVRPERRVLF